MLGRAVRIEADDILGATGDTLIEIDGRTSRSKVIWRGSRVILCRSQ
jgi:hypothetical protein